MSPARPKTSTSTPPSRHRSPGLLGRRPCGFLGHRSDAGDSLVLGPAYAGDGRAEPLGGRHLRTRVLRVLSVRRRGAEEPPSLRSGPPRSAVTSNLLSTTHTPSRESGSRGPSPSPTLSQRAVRQSPSSSRCCSRPLSNAPTHSSPTAPPTPTRTRWTRGTCEYILPSLSSSAAFSPPHYGAHHIEARAGLPSPSSFHAEIHTDSEGQRTTCSTRPLNPDIETPQRPRSTSRPQPGPHARAS